MHFRRHAFILTFGYWLLSTLLLAATEVSDEVAEIRVTSPQQNGGVPRVTSIVGEVEFSQSPSDRWAAFVVIRAPDGAYYFSTWNGKINRQILRVRDVGGRQVAGLRVDDIYFGRPGTSDLGKWFDFYVVVLKEAEIAEIVKGVCPRLRDTDSCIGSTTEFRNLAEMAPSVSVSDPVRVKRQ